MSGFVYSAVFNEKFYPYADKLITSLRRSGYDRKIYLITDGNYHPDDAGCVLLTFDIRAILREFHNPDNKYWCTKYYIDRLLPEIPGDMLYLDADCFVIEGRTIEGMFVDHNAFVASKVSMQDFNRWNEWIFLSGIPEEIRRANPRGYTIRGGTFLIKQDYVVQFCEGVRQEIESGTGQIEEAHCNAFLWKHRDTFPWDFWGEKFVFYGPVHYIGYRAAPRMCIHHVMDWWRP